MNFGLQNRQPRSPQRCAASMTSPVPWMPRDASASSYDQEAMARSPSQGSYCDPRSSSKRMQASRLHASPAKKGLPPLGGSPLQSRMLSTSPARMATGLPLANQTWSRGHSKGVRQDQPAARLARGYHHGDNMRQTWSTGFLPSNERQTMSNGFLPTNEHQFYGRKSPSDMRQTWSMGFLPSSDQHMASRPSLGALRSQRAASKSIRQGFALFGLPVWDSLLQILPLRAAGSLAAVSRICAEQLRRDLIVAVNATRRCKVCDRDFKYATGRGECWYHPGKEQVSLCGDAPGAGMMDVSWTCCGRGSAYAVGLSMACTRTEVQGCCARNHRAKPCAVREAGRGNALRASHEDGGYNQGKAKSMNGLESLPWNHLEPSGKVWRLPH